MPIIAHIANAWAKSGFGEVQISGCI